MFKLRPKEYKAWLRPNVATTGRVITNRRPRKASKKYEFSGRFGHINVGRQIDDTLVANTSGENQIEFEEQEFHQDPGANADSDDHVGHGTGENNTEFEENECHQNADSNSDSDESQNSMRSGRCESINSENNPCDCHHCQGNDESEDILFKAAENYFDKLSLFEKLSPNLGVSKFETLLMILTITMRHGMTGPLIEDLLKFVNIIVGDESLPTSSHMFQKIFSVDSGLKYHFICEDCNLYLGEHSSFENSVTECENCKRVCNVKPSILNEGTFFITLSAQQQMQEVVSRNKDNFVSASEGGAGDGVLRGIQSGLLYQSLCEEGQPLAQNPDALTLTIGTDGGQVFENSSKNSMWPIQAVCNELHESVRFLPCNMILLGLWFGKNSPEMSAFLKPVAEDLNNLETNGVVREINGTQKKCPVYTIMCVCDSVAKAKLQNIVQFNGYFGCGYCMQRGEIIEATSNQIRYPFTGKRYKLRSEDCVRNAMIVASETATNEDGVKGLSPLLMFNSLHLVFGIPIDYMHAILLGVVKRLVSLWFDESSNGKRYYIKKFEVEIDKLLADITPPSKLATRPKLLSKRVHWKAKDWGNFLLFWGIVVLEKFLPRVYLENFRDLSNGIFILLQEKISPEDIEAADIMLTRFTKNFNMLYGDINMVYNVHLVTHLVQIAKFCGSIANFSAFAFEGGIGYLTKLVKGTNSVASQICRKYLISKALPHIVLSYNFMHPSVETFCEEILTFRKNKQSILVDGVTLVGGEKLYFLNESERQKFVENGYNVGEFITSFYRAIYKGKVYTSQEYKRPKRSNDTCVQLKTGEFGLVNVILTVNNDCLVIFTELRLCPEHKKTRNVHICAGNPFKAKVLVPFNQIARKCIFFSVGDHRYLSYRPNEFERDM